MKKEDLLRLIAQISDGDIISLEEVSYDGTPNSKSITKITFEEYIGRWTIK